jgi:hypothetical protein
MAGLAKPVAFEMFCRRAKKIKWVVFAKAPFGGPDQILKYLARYTHRVAISNRRLLSMEDGRVTFAYKDYAEGNKSKVMSLEATEFIRRFLLISSPAALCASGSSDFWPIGRAEGNWNCAASCW